MIPTMPFGKTGRDSTRIIFGAAALGSVSQDDADKTLEVLLDYGIDHFDVAAGYGKGEAEKRMAPWMKRCRNDIFLATKTGRWTYDEAKQQFHESLERMRVDRVDLIQLHGLVIPDQWEIALGSGGALEYLIEAKEEGLTRFIGVTGHGFTVADMHMKSLERYPFDSVLLPYNYLMMKDEAYAASFKKLVGMCRERGVAVQTIKSLARRPWNGEKTRTTWYELLENQADIERAVSWALSNPDVFVITSGDIHVLPKVLAAASKGLLRPSDDEMDGMIAEQDMELIFDGPTRIGFGDAPAR
ncbi:MAG: aldo/keto reductase [Gemmatimonadetes bacterium]|jgi:aryl-alcohol dehydrogenase-like predicted oxidoreductase|nr:aldo/keto reductase [Gemmatimonadota bacterium]